MSDILRAVKLPDKQSDRIYVVLECVDATFVARLLQEFMARNALEKKRAWSEVHREEFFVSYATGELVVKKKSEEKEDSEIWEVMEDE